MLDEYLKKMGLTRYEVSKKSGISEATWARVNRRPLADYTVRQLSAIGVAVDKRPTTVLRELIELERKQDHNANEEPTS